ncbi:og domain-containing [Pyrenophora seminiperda CCB06]|uniref:Og domain-containing n=1 Tax=Pyrenophora seminiperda CCB06 TaxID=1302712 RepID=A0A3M7M1U8_9PLEO|nr:og domain-containing [Pyrenophora seminiperda CCB06]
MPPLQEERLSDFTAHAWCNALLSDTSYTIRTRSTLWKQMGVSIPLIARSLYTDDTIPAWLSLYRSGNGARRAPPPPPPNKDDAGEGGGAITSPIPLSTDSTPITPTPSMLHRLISKTDLLYSLSDPALPQHIILCSLQGGLDGRQNRLHGGIVSALLDTSMGLLVFQAYGTASSTCELRVVFRKPVRTPGVYGVRARMWRQRGRWVEMKGWVEDGEEGVYAEAWATFLIPRGVGVGWGRGSEEEVGAMIGKGER